MLCASVDFEVTEGVGEAVQSSDVAAGLSVEALSHLLRSSPEERGPGGPMAHHAQHAGQASRVGLWQYLCTLEAACDRSRGCEDLGTPFLGLRVSFIETFLLCS